MAYGKEKIMKLKESKSDFIFNVVNSIILIIVSIVCLYPLVFVVSASISNPDALVSGKVILWPVGFSLEGYKATFAYKQTWIGFFNSAFYALLGTLISLFTTITAAYPLSRKDFKGRSVFTFIFAFTMWFSGGMIPTYLVVKNLGLLDTRWALVLPTGISVYNMLIVKSYFENNLPDELLESCKLDGCSDLVFLRKFAIPLSKPVLAVVTLFNIVGFWNSYFYAFLYISKRELYPLQIFLREILLMNQTSDLIGQLDLASLAKRERLSELIKYSLIVISSFPIIIIYPFIQKYFVSGILIGSIKG